jgi:hypothetical protein
VWVSVSMHGCWHVWVLELTTLDEHSVFIHLQELGLQIVCYVLQLGNRYAHTACLHSDFCLKNSCNRNVNWVQLPVKKFLWSSCSLIQNEQESHMWKMEAVWRKCLLYLHCVVLLVFSVIIILILFLAQLKGNCKRLARLTFVESFGKGFF